jgi:hypothetical protein
VPNHRAHEVPRDGDDVLAGEGGGGDAGFGVTDPRADAIPSDRPDFTQELPRKLLPTRAKGSQRRRRENR